MTLFANPGPASPSAAVRTAAETETNDILETLTLAFSDDPVVRWAFSDDRQYDTYFPPFAKAFGGGAIALRTAFVSGDAAGAALWMPPGEAPDEDAMMAVMEEAIPTARLQEIGELFAAMDEYHPSEPHWYLPLIGVRPARQGEGHGSALLSEALRLCDKAGLPAYLEATSERNMALYKRHGFEPVAEVSANGSPTITPMLRPAR